MGRTYGRTRRDSASVSHDLALVEKSRIDASAAGSMPAPRARISASASAPLRGCRTPAARNRRRSPAPRSRRTPPADVRPTIPRLLFLERRLGHVGALEVEPPVARQVAIQDPAARRAEKFSRRRDRRSRGNGRRRARAASSPRARARAARRAYVRRRDSSRALPSVRAAAGRTRRSERGAPTTSEIRELRTGDAMPKRSVRQQRRPRLRVNAIVKHVLDVVERHELFDQPELRVQIRASASGKPATPETRTRTFGYRAHSAMIARNSASSGSGFSRWPRIKACRCRPENSRNRAERDRLMASRPEARRTPEAARARRNTEFPTA